MQPPSSTTASPLAPRPHRCLNCGAEIAGRYCGNCSQAADVHVPSTREFVHEALEGLTHSDSRLWRTLLCLWLHPGRLTLEFVAGRRMAYLPPFRLYLIFSVLFFFLASLSPQHAPLLQLDDSARLPPSDQVEKTCSDTNFMTFTRHPDWNRRLLHACKAIVSDNGASLEHVVLATIPKAMFVFLPLVAWLHMLMYWWPRLRYAEHLLFFLHVHAFFFSIAILFMLLDGAQAAWPALHSVTNATSTLLGWWVPVYTVLAMRRVFHRSWPNTMLKAAVLLVAYLAVLALTVGCVFIYAALQL